ncbi:sensor histidine kinase [Paenibacillus thalictri]|nr:sensor histidine kinase [Paenibacillus thalictri]
MKLKNKIFLSCVSIIVLLSLLFSNILYRYVTLQTTQSFYENSTYSLIQVSNYMDEKLKGLLGRVHAMQLNTSFDKMMKNFLYYDEPNFNAIAVSEFSNSFSEIRSSDPFISSIFMYTPKGNFFDLTRPLKYSFDFKSSRLYKQIEQQPKKTLYWGSSGSDEIYADGKLVIPVVLRFSIEGYNGDSLLVINLDCQEIYGYLAGTQPGEGSWAMIMDDMGKEIAAYHYPVINSLTNDAQLMNQITANHNGTQTVNYGSEEYLVTYQTTRIAPWKIVTVKSESILLKNLRQFKTFTTIMMVIGVFVCFFFALIISNSLIKPLVLLQNTMKKVTDKNFNIRFHYKYRNEVGQLGDSFNYMVGEMKDLVGKLNASVAQLQEEKEKVKNEQLLKRRAELRSLQAQINPHFLYNTLDSINWKANEINAHEISKMTTSLASLFRTGLSKGHEIIPIKDEISHISSYLTIQQMRYGDKFSYRLDIENSVLELYTVKLILQPLVENAIYHGIKEKDGCGSIVISGAQTARGVEFGITDDGTGISPLQMKLINKRLSEGFVVEKDGYGIYNVNERIKLHFGMEYGLEFFSEHGKGTTVKVVIPQVKWEDAHKYA